jgi:hypothetical protein
MVSARVGGANWFSRITDPEEQLHTSQAFMRSLAALHRIDPGSLHLPAFPPPTTVPELVDHELDEWEGVLAARGGEPDPALRFSIGWLRRNIPVYETPVVLVQGDTGPGNFMYEGGKVVAVVDWELAHLGDPMDDIAWLALRSAQDPFPDFPTRLREYEMLSGISIDDDRVRYYQVMAETKLQVMRHRPGGLAVQYASDDGGGHDLGNGLIYAMFHRRLWLEALAEATGIDLVGVDKAPDVERSEFEVLADVLLDQLRHVVVPRITDSLAAQRSKGFARVIKYLTEIHLHGPYYDQQELEEIAALLGARPDTLGLGRRAVADAVQRGALGDLEYLGYLWRRVGRENELMRSASGALADRHWPALR